MTEVVDAFCRKKLLTGHRGGMRALWKRVGSVVRYISSWKMILLAYRRGVSLGLGRLRG